MKVTNLFSKTTKSYPKDEISVSSQLLIRAGFINKVSSGVYTLLPLGLKTVVKISDIVRDEMQKLAASEVLMPGLVPRENLEKTGRWETFDALFKFKGTDEKEYALGATHEEIVVPLAKNYTFSYKDLPFAIFQIQNKFRNETRAKSGLLRTREFIMKDLYSFHENEADLDKYYEKMKESYWRIFERCGIKDKTYLTFASGGSFSKYSHEFQTETEAGEDEVYVCKSCKTGLNKEILDESFKCPNCETTEYEIIKAVEVGNIFKLADKYSKPFDLTYIDKDGKPQVVLMGCYGIGIQRLMGTVAEINHDKDGLVWPRETAPFSAYLIALDDRDDDAEKLYQKLIDNKIEVIYDNRDQLSAGEKFADCDLMGIPYRIVISNKTNDKYELKERTKKEALLLSFEELLEALN